MIMVMVFLSILNRMEFHSVQNRKENCHNDHIPFNVKGNRNIVFSVIGLGPGNQNLGVLIENEKKTSETKNHANFVNKKSLPTRTVLNFKLLTSRGLNSHR